MKTDSYRKIEVLINGLATGFLLQLAVGPVFFFIVNLALQETILDGLAGVLAVTLVDYFYIALAIAGVGSLLERKNVKKILGTVSSVVLILFGLVILRAVLAGTPADSQIDGGSKGPFSSFLSVILLTISSPMTIVFFTGVFTAKAIERRLTKEELTFFGLGTGLATLLFMGSSVLLFSFLKGTLPAALIQTLNLIVGALLMGYGGMRLVTRERPARAEGGR